MVRMSIESSKPSRIESALVYLALATIALSLLSIVASVVAGTSDRWAVSEGWWPVAYGIALWGLPAGFVLMIAAIGLGQRRRRAAAKAIREQA